MLGWRAWGDLVTEEVLEHLAILRDELLGGRSDLALVELFMGLGLQRDKSSCWLLFIAEVRQS